MKITQILHKSNVILKVAAAGTFEAKVSIKKCNVDSSVETRDTLAPREYFLRLGAPIFYCCGKNIEVKEQVSSGEKNMYVVSMEQREKPVSLCEHGKVGGSVHPSPEQKHQKASSARIIKVMFCM